MNWTRMIILAIVLIYVGFFLINTFFPYAFAKQGITEEINFLVIAAEKNQGTFNSKYSIEFKQGLELTKEDFETQNTTIEFQCNDYEKCCGENEECTEKIAWTKNKIKFNKDINPITSVRCEKQNEKNHCKIYIGKVPAQIQLTELNYDENISFNSEKLKVNAIITNYGGLTEDAALMQTKIFIYYLDGEEKKTESVNEFTSKSTKINIQETKILEQEIELKTPGKYLIKVKLTGRDFGSIEKSFTVNATGEPEYECKKDTTKTEIVIDPKTVAETKIVECDIKRFCTDCMQAFECKKLWKEENPEKTFEAKTKEYTAEKAKGTNCKTN